MSLDEYHFQLSQVNSALEKDSENKELIKLRDDLSQLLELLQAEVELEKGLLQKEAKPLSSSAKPTFPKSNSKNYAPELGLLEGDTVLGKWSDGNYYECLIVGKADSDHDVEAYEVVFTGNDSIQILTTSQLKRPRKDEKMPTLLTSKEVTVGEIKGKQKSNKYTAGGGSNNQASQGGASGKIEKKAKKNSKRDEEDKVRVNAWQSFAAKGKVSKKVGTIVALSGSKTFTSFASRGKHRFQAAENGEGDE